MSCLIITNKVTFLGDIVDENELFIKINPINKPLSEEKYNELLEYTGLSQIFAIRYPYKIKMEDVKLIIDVSKKPEKIYED